MFAAARTVHISMTGGEEEEDEGPWMSAHFPPQRTADGGKRFRHIVACARKRCTELAALCENERGLVLQAEFQGCDCAAFGT